MLHGNINNERAYNSFKDALAYNSMDNYAEIFNDFIIFISFQEAFTSVDAGTCKDCLTEEQEAHLGAALQSMNAEVFLDELYKAIVLLFTKKEEQDTRNYLVGRNDP